MAQRTSYLLERDHELEVLGSRCLALARGEGGLVVVRGQAGVGKTSLLREIARRGRADRLRVIQGRGYDRESGTPYGVVRQLLDPVIAALGDDEKTAVFTGAARGARRLFEGESAGSGVGGHAGDLLGALWWLVLGLSEREPLLVVVDDLQHCDLESLHWLAFVAHRLEAVPILLTVAVRTGEPGRDENLLADITAEPHAVQLELGPLQEASTLLLVADALGPAAAGGVAAACHQATAGNPLLLRELIRALAACPPAELDDATVLRIGARAVTGLVARRLVALPPEAVSLAQSVAVLGDRSPLPIAAAVAGLGDEAALVAAERLEQADLLQPSAELEFVHPLVGKALYLSLPRPEREKAHLRAAAVLRASNAPVHAVAAQVSLLPPGRYADALPLLRDAARDALANGARHSAVTYLRRALDEPMDDGRRAELLTELGTAETLVNGQMAAEHLRQALSLTPDAVRRAELTAVLGPALFFTQRNAEALAAYEDALRDLPDDERALRQRLEAGLLAAAVDDTRLYPAARHHAARLRQVPPADMEPPLASVLSWHEARTGGAAGRCVALADRGLTGVSAQDAAAVFAYAGLVLAVLDRYDDVRALCDRTIDGARSSGSVFAFAIASWLRGIVAYLAGDLGNAEADQRQAIDAGEEHGLSAGLIYAYARLAEALTERGDLPGAQAALDHVAVGDPLPPLAHFDWWLQARGRLRLAQGRPADARDDFTLAGRRYELLDGVNPAFIAWRSDLALAHLALGDRDTARSLADDELDRARAWTAGRVLGRALRIAAQTRPPREALPLLRESRDILQTSPARLERAQTEVALGVALARLGDRASARATLWEGLEDANRFGAVPLTQLAHDELVRAGARPRRATRTGAAALTATERRVAELAAGGRTNREVAQALFVSPKTIEMHLANAFRKLRIDSRSQLSRALVSGDQDSPVG